MKKLNSAIKTDPRDLRARRPRGSVFFDFVFLFEICLWAGGLVGLGVVGCRILGVKVFGFQNY